MRAATEMHAPGQTSPAAPRKWFTIIFTKKRATYDEENNIIDKWITLRQVSIEKKKEVPPFNYNQNQGKPKLHNFIYYFYLTIFKTVYKTSNNNNIIKYANSCAYYIHIAANFVSVPWTL